jgi:hypothetical protein
MNGDLNFPDQAQSGLIQSPIVYVKDEPVWEYKQVVRNLAQEKAPTEEELIALRADGWELAGTFTASPFVYFYFKRLAE